MTGRRGTPWDRFWPKVEVGDCWNWTASRSRLGYGRFGYTGSTVKLAHRVAWEMLVGPIPAGMDLDHLCRNPSCVNPDHLEPVTRRENMRRGVASHARSIRLRSQTHCKHGHSLHDAYLAPKNGKRNCRTCRQLRAA